MEKVDSPITLKMLQDTFARCKKPDRYQPVLIVCHPSEYDAMKEWAEKILGAWRR